jgi:hypothetical protein
MLRLEGSTQFALSVGAGECGFSKTLVINSLQRRFNTRDDDSLENELKHYFDVLISLEDFGKLGDRKGYIPRESRVTALAKGWARISGGLPDYHNECPDDKGTQIIPGTIGRLTRMHDIREIPPSWEIKQTYLWEDNRCKDAVARIEESLSTVEKLGDKELQYYHSALSPNVTRWNCWHPRLPGETMSIARSVTASPRSYYLLNPSTSVGVALSRDDALLYLMHLDRLHQRHMPCNVEFDEPHHRLTVPRLLPSDWENALVAGSLGYTDLGNCLEYTITKEAWPFADSVLRAASFTLNTLRHV